MKMGGGGNWDYENGGGGGAVKSEFLSVALYW